MSDLRDLFFKARNNLVRMFKDRNYTMEDGSSLDSLTLSYSEFEPLYTDMTGGGDSLDIKGNVLTRDKKKVYVSFTTDTLEKPNPSRDNLNLTNLFEHFEPKSDSDFFNQIIDVLNDAYVMVVYPSALKDGYHQNSQMERNLHKKLGKYRYYFQFYQVQRLTFCLLDNNIMPSIKLVDKDKFTDTSKLQRFMSNDPVVKWFGAKPGDIFEVRRQTSVAWRIVAKGQSEHMKVKK